MGCTCSIRKPTEIQNYCAEMLFLNAVSVYRLLHERRDNEPLLNIFIVTSEY